jgi:hypothetical protein
VSSQPIAASQERDAPEGTTRAASPEIQEAEEGSRAALSQGAASGDALALDLARAPWRLPLRPVMTPRTMRRLRRATPLSTGWHGHAAHSMS